MEALDEIEKRLLPMFTSIGNNNDNSNTNNRDNAAGTGGSNGGSGEDVRESGTGMMSWSFEPQGLEQQQQQQQKQQQQDHELGQGQRFPELPPYLMQSENSQNNSSSNVIGNGPWTNGEHENRDGAKIAPLSANVIINNEYAQLAEFIRKCKGYDEKKVVLFVEKLVLLIGGGEQEVQEQEQGQEGEEHEGEKHKQEQLDGDADGGEVIDNEKSTVFGGHGANEDEEKKFKYQHPSEIYMNDAIDKCSISCTFLVPDDAIILGYLIGKGGTNISDIESIAQVRIRVTGPAECPDIPERPVHVVGKLSSCVHAQHLLYERIATKLRDEGFTTCLTTLVIPHDFVSHVIGKRGSYVTRVQDISKARVKVDHVTRRIGRTVRIMGTPRQRTHAHYMIARQLAKLQYSRPLPVGGSTAQHGFNNNYRKAGQHNFQKYPRGKPLQHQQQQGGFQNVSRGSPIEKTNKQPDAAWSGSSVALNAWKNKSANAN